MACQRVSQRWTCAIAAVGAGTSLRTKRCLPKGDNNLPREVTAMTRTMTALAAAATMAVAAVAVPQQAEARWGGHGGWHGGGAVLGGLAAGAIIGGALAGPYYYGGGPYYGGYGYYDGGP